MAFGFPPKGWALCNGQLLPIMQNQALFSLLGTTYGGDGRTNFALPNLQGRIPIHFGAGYVLGQNGGEQVHTLSVNEIPAHFHVAQASRDNGSSPIPGTTSVLGAVNNAYGPSANTVTLAPATIDSTGGSQPHQNLQPFLALSFCIALQGIFPTPN